MNERGHVLNAVLLGIGVGIVVDPSLTLSTGRSILEIGLPVTLGALFPDVDTTFGTHRKTLHNLPVLAAFLAFPYYFDNLHFVWLGILTHYVLDVLGTTRGIALFYPLWSEEFGLPFGIPVASKWTDVVTVVITALELAVVAAIVHRVPQLSIEYGRQALGF